jgi:HlyD family secretion protein
MKKRFSFIVVVVFVIASWLAGCNGTPNAATAPSSAPAQTSDGTAIPVVVKDEEGKIYAEGVVQPARSVTLRAGTSGLIAAVPVAENAQVTAGDVLVRFDAADAELAIQQAKAGLALAQAQLDLAKAGARPEQIAVIESQLAAASAALTQTTAQRDEQNAYATEADVLDAQASMMEVELAQTQAEDTHDDMMKCYTYTLPDGSEKDVCPTLGTYEELTRYQMEAVDAALLAAQAQYGAAQEMVTPQRDAAQAAVQSALAQRDAVQAQLDLAKAGARAEEVAVAAAAVQRAETALAQAQAALDFTIIDAPFDGVVTDLPVDAGDTVAAGDPLVTLATLDQLQIETTDLTELDVVSVTVGQNALVTLDAKPDELLSGHVARIDPQGNNYLGDTLYTVVIALDAPAPAWMRWGMTAQVEIQSQESTSEESANGDSIIEPSNSSTIPVIAEAILEPARWSQLRFTVNGKVVEVLVATGDYVKQGDVLLRLDAALPTLAVKEAEAAVATAQAQLALTKAGPRPEEIAAADARLAAAQGEVERAIALRAQLKAGMDAETAGLQAQLEAASAAYKQALITIGNSDDEDARKQLNLLTLRVQAADARVAALPKVSAARLRAADAGIQAAQANVAAIQAELDLLQTPPTPETIAVAEAEVRQAEAALAAARIALARTELHAPFDGVVTQVFAEVGENVGAGQPVFILADVDRLQRPSLTATTIDLVERNIVGLTEGQTVQVTVDALPGRTFDGRITQIKQQSTDYRGDVTYPTTIQLEESTPELRWGMRVAVEIP